MPDTPFPAVAASGAAMAHPAPAPAPIAADDALTALDAAVTAWESATLRRIDPATETLIAALAGAVVALAEARADRRAA